jgi:hypothetical protein
VKSKHVIGLGCLALALCACPDTHQRLGYHQIPVSWGTGYENVPDCTPLIAMQGTSLNVKGVSVTTPAGVGVGGGELNKEQKALQTASDTAVQADQQYTRLCKLLPSYSHDQVAFYKARDQMFDLIHGTNQVASAVAAQTGQAAPALPPSVPTLASNAAASAGINPGKGVANLPATTTAALGKTTPAPATPNAALSNLVNATSKLKKAAEKKPPSRHATPKSGAAAQ